MCVWGGGLAFGWGACLQLVMKHQRVNTMADLFLQLGWWDCERWRLLSSSIIVGSSCNWGEVRKMCGAQRACGCGCLLLLAEWVPC